VVEGNERLRNGQAVVFQKPEDREQKKEDRGQKTEGTGGKRNKRMPKVN
jgi:hypothetical protein